MGALVAFAGCDPSHPLLTTVASDDAHKHAGGPLTSPPGR